MEQLDRATIIEYEAIYKKALDDFDRLIALYKQQIVEYEALYEYYEKLYKEKEEKYLCKICYKNEINAYTTCGHTGCYNCLILWMSKESTCPLCRCTCKSVKNLYF